jgi:hypothetical protein
MNLKRFTKEQLKKITAVWITTPTAATDSEPHRVSAPLKERTLVEGIAGTFYYHYAIGKIRFLAGIAH